MKYLSKIKIWNSPKIGLVDVGWSGTIQNCIKKILPQTEIYGFYIGLDVKAQGMSSSYKEGLLFDDRKKKECYGYLFSLYEVLLCADHGATAGYDNNGNPITYCDSDISLFNQYCGDIQKDIFKNFCQIVESYIQNNDYQWERKVRYFHSRMIIHFTKQEKKILQNAVLLHSDNLANRPLLQEFYKIGWKSKVWIILNMYK